MNITPSSKITLYKGVKIMDGKNIIFRSQSAQQSYFNSKKFKESVNCTYIRKTRNVVKVEMSMAEAVQCNFISFTNSAFENKTFYARIVNVEYVNNKTTLVSYAIDWFQTDMFNMTIERANIAREHLSQADYNKSVTNPFDRTIYEFETDEGLAVGKSMETSYIIDYNLRKLPLRDSNTLGALFLISTFDEDNIEYEGQKVNVVQNFWNNFDYAFRPSGEAIVESYQFPFPPSGMPRAYNIAFISNIQNRTKQDKMTDALNWLTLMGLTHSIIGIYGIKDSIWLHALVESLGSPEDKITVDGNSTSFSTIENKKLMRSPFHYLRVDNMLGDRKEYFFEDFAEAGVHNGKARFQYKLVIDGVPIISFIPKDYKMLNNEQDINEAFPNFDERMDITNIPQIGYMTDAFLSYLSSVYSSNIGSRTQTSEIMNKVKAFGGGFFGDIADAFNMTKSIMTAGKSDNELDLIGGVAGSVGNLAVSTMDRNTQNKLYRESNASRAMSGESATAIATGQTVEGDKVGTVFGDAKSAFVNDEYHAGSGNGSLPLYIMPELYQSFVVCWVELRESILRQYDNYFTLYGFTSHRIGVPRFYNYIRGSVDDSVTPHFNGNVKATYIQTDYVDVEATTKESEMYIKSMLNAGCRLYKGEEL